MADLTLDAYLEKARRDLTRVGADSLEDEAKAGALVVDIRPAELRERHGELPGALVIGLNVLEWRLAPSSDHRIVDIAPGRKVILVCQEGYSSSLAAARLRALGVPGATDLVGGYAALALPAARPDP